MLIFYKFNNNYESDSIKKQSLKRNIISHIEVTNSYKKSKNMLILLKGEITLSLLVTNYRINVLILSSYLKIYISLSSLKLTNN